MSKFQVQLKQGRDVKTVTVQAKTFNSVLSFFEAISTMKVFEIRKIEYNAPSDSIPVDDFNYYPVVKTIAHVDDSNENYQMIFNNVKKTINEQELFRLMKEHLEIDGLDIDSIMCTLFKESVF